MPEPILSPSGVEGLFSDTLTKLKAAAGAVEADVEQKFGAIIGDTKATVQSTLTAVAPSLEGDMTALEGAVFTALNAFIATQKTPADMKVLIQAVAATGEAAITKWSTAYIASLPNLAAAA